MIDHLDTTYDYGSVMHYASTAFSKNGKPTIEPKKRGVEIGQRAGFSETDIYKINKLYKCAQFGKIIFQNRFFLVIFSLFQDCSFFALLFLATTTLSPEEELKSQKQGNNKTTLPPNDKNSNELPDQETDNISGGISGGERGGSGTCRDKRRDCEFLSRSGHCESRFSQKFMTENCPKSCHKCQITCEDSRSWCERWANSGMCTQSIFKDYMKQKCAKSCQLC